MKTLLRVLLLGLILSSLVGCARRAADPGRETAEQKAERLAWWREARFGMFIHWGPASLKGVELSWSRGTKVPIAEYDNLYKQFNPTQFDAREWVSLAKEAGMKYIVLTTKHHDGFALWDSKYSDHDVMATPFGRDVVKELSNECRRQGIPFCAYFSITDWYHPDYTPRFGGDPRPVEGADFQRFLTFMNNQLGELLTNYGPIGILWFDGVWDKHWTDAQTEELYQFVRRMQPDIIVNNRVDEGHYAGHHKKDPSIPWRGDYLTPEQEVGAFDRERPWETCMTITGQWGWKADDDVKPLATCIRNLVMCAGGDGNLLLNVGPRPDGRIEPGQEQVLREMGNWLKQYGKTIYGTTGGPFKPGAWGASTCKGNAVFVHIFKFEGEAIKLPAIEQKVVGFKVLTGGTAKVTQTGEGIEIAVPVGDRGALDTIVRLELDGAAEGIGAR